MYYHQIRQEHEESINELLRLQELAPQLASDYFFPSSQGTFKCQISVPNEHHRFIPVPSSKIKLK